VKLVGDHKKKLWEEMSPEAKAAMTPEDRELAQSWDGTTCQLHLLNVLGMACVGPLIQTKQGKLKIPHGRAEHYVQKTLMGADILRRHFELVTGRKFLCAITNYNAASIPDDTLVELECKAGASVFTIAAKWKHALLKYGFQRLQQHWHKCPTNPKPAPWSASLIPSASSGLYSSAKLFGHTGDISKYQLNESKLLRSWSIQNGILQKRLWKACKTHRFGWNFECGEILILNAPAMLPMLHKLRVCTAKPNKLVMGVWEVLSCQYTMSACAARAIINRSPPFPFPSLFATSALLRLPRPVFQACADVSSHPSPSPSLTCAPAGKPVPYARSYETPPAVVFPKGTY